ncbi:MAG: TerC family protein [Bdellovibrionaceae bacterium]|nr:TerC family protein [Pseudobdellovibrionaceae bacterium]
MDSTLLFPFFDNLPIYIGFVFFVILVLILDLGVFHKNPHEVRFKEAAWWSLFWVSLSLVFNVFLYWYAGYIHDSVVAKQVALEFLTGFVVEKSLAVDNLFVFITVFSFFGIPAKYQHRVLFFGILGALIFRAIFIAMGSYLMAFKEVVIFFGILLIFTGVKLVFTPEGPKDLSQNFVIRWMQKIFPIHHRIEGTRFFHKVDGRWMVTPLFLALIVLEFTDIIFAVDSVPAIFALTKEPLIVFTSNICAILGLRSMYFMLAGVADRFHYLKFGLAAVLIFVGLKMAWLNEAFDGHFPISWSLALIAFFIGSSMIVSWLRPVPPELPPPPSEPRS